MNLVKQRIKWEYEYAFGKPVEFQAFLDYKKYRHTEDFRLNSGLEQFMEYTISLENKIAELTSSR